MHLPLYMCVPVRAYGTTRMQVPVEGRRRCQIAWNWSCSCCELPVWVLRATPEPSAGGASALNPVLSPQTFIHIPVEVYLLCSVYQYHFL